VTDDEKRATAEIVRQTVDEIERRSPGKVDTITCESKHKVLKRMIAGADDRVMQVHEGIKKFETSTQELQKQVGEVNVRFEHHLGQHSGELSGVHKIRAKSNATIKAITILSADTYTWEITSSIGAGLTGDRGEVWPQSKKYSTAWKRWTRKTTRRTVPSRRKLSL